MLPQPLDQMPVTIPFRLVYICSPQYSVLHDPTAVHYTKRYNYCSAAE